MTEMDKMVEGLIPLQDGNSAISSLHKKSVLVGIMGPMTRSTRRRTGDSLDVLLQVVLESGNNAVVNSAPSLGAAGIINFIMKKSEDNGDLSRGGVGTEHGEWNELNAVG